MSSQSRSAAGPVVPALSEPREAATRGAAKRSFSRMAWTAATVGAPLALIGVLTWPMLFTSSGLGGDWEHHLWYVWHQSLTLRSDHTPSFFLNTDFSVLYPEYVFYGATIYALDAALALALGGSSIAAYVVSYVLGFLAAYGGWYWMGRIAGLDRLRSHAPALVFVTSAYYLTLTYGRGDWPEFLAISVIPLMVAAGLCVARAERLQVLPFATLIGSGVIFFGSHNLTMLWGSTLLVILCVLIAMFIPAARRAVRPRGLLRVAAAIVPAALVNAWFLLPAVVYAGDTKIGSNYHVAYETLHYTMHLVSFAHLFTFSRATTVPGVPDFALALPTLVMIWVIVSSAVVLYSFRRSGWTRLLLILCVATALLAIVMTHAALILALPKPYTLIQFGYRLESYILIGVTAAVLAVLVVTRDGSRKLRWYGWTIAPILAISLIGAVQQVDAYPHTVEPRAATFTRGSEVFASDYYDYGYAPLPLVGGKTLPLLKATPEAIHDNRLSATVRARPGQLMYTNIGGGPDLLNISGARVVGRDAEYRLVLAIGPPSATPSAHPHTALAAEHIVISPADPPPVVLGRVLSLIAVLVLVIELVWLVLVRPRRARPASHPAQR